MSEQDPVVQALVQQNKILESRNQLFEEQNKLLSEQKDLLETRLEQIEISVSGIDVYKFQQLEDRINTIKQSFYDIYYKI